MEHNVLEGGAVTVGENEAVAVDLGGRREEEGRTQSGCSVE